MVKKQLGVRRVPHLCLEKKKAEKKKKGGGVINQTTTLHFATLITVSNGSLVMVTDLNPAF